MRECADQGIKHVWMHRSFATGGVSEAAGRLITVPTARRRQLPMR
jgi:hypothetical protein